MSAMHPNQKSHSLSFKLTCILWKTATDLLTNKKKNHVSAFPSDKHCISLCRKCVICILPLLSYRIFQRHILEAKSFQFFIMDILHWNWHYLNSGYMVTKNPVTSTVDALTPAFALWHNGNEMKKSKWHLSFIKKIFLWWKNLNFIMKIRLTS